MYKKHFGGPVKFKAAQNALVFSQADMELPFVTYNASTLAKSDPLLLATNGPHRNRVFVNCRPNVTTLLAWAIFTSKGLSRFSRFAVSVLVLFAYH